MIDNDDRKPVGKDIDNREPVGKDNDDRELITFNNQPGNPFYENLKQYHRGSNLFYEQHLSNDELTWELVTQDNKLVDFGIITDPEIMISVDHEYNTGISDPLGGALKSMLNLGKTAAPYINNLTNKGSGNNALENIGKLIDDKTGGNQGGNAANAVVDVAQKGVGYMNRLAKTLSNGQLDFTHVINSAFLTSFDMVKTFTGTDVSFQFPRLETTWVHGLPTYQEYVNNVKDRFEYVTNKIIGDAKTLLNLYGLQTAPNNFQPEFAGLVDDKQPIFKGTFKLRIGNMYTIDNIIIKNWVCQASTVKARGTDSPLYATVVYTVEIASYLTKGQLQNIFRNSLSRGG